MSSSLPFHLSFVVRLTRNRGEDQTNISNAYVSGLKEDFGLYGNELNYFNVCYYVAYVVFQIPGLLLMSRPQL